MTSSERSASPVISILCAGISQTSFPFFSLTLIQAASKEEITVSFEKLVPSLPLIYSTLDSTITGLNSLF